MLKESIPYEIGDCLNLLSLNLSNNELNGTIPHQIGNLTALENLLDFSYNSLSCQIPSDLGKLKNLIILDISHNNLSGSIPDSLGEMFSLSSINLSYNNLEGHVPNSGNSSYPLDLSNNKELRGNIQGLQSCNVSVIEPGGGSDKKKVVAAILGSSEGALLVSSALVCIFVFGCKTRAMKQIPANENKNPFYILYFNGKIVYEDIIEATKNFDDTSCIGEGTLGQVYQAEMPGGQVVAVKRLGCEADSLEFESIKSFKSEVEA